MEPRTRPLGVACTWCLERYVGAASLVEVLAVPEGFSTIRESVSGYSHGRGTPRAGMEPFGHLGASWPRPSKASGRGPSGRIGRQGGCGANWPLGSARRSGRQAVPWRHSRCVREGGSWQRIDDEGHEEDRGKQGPFIRATGVRRRGRGTPAGRASRSPDGVRTVGSFPPRDRRARERPGIGGSRRRRPDARRGGALFEREGAASGGGGALR